MFLEKNTTIKSLSYLTLLTIVLGLIIFVWGQVNYFKKTHVSNKSIFDNIFTANDNDSVAEQVRHFITSLTIVLFFFILLLTLYFASISYIR